MIKHIIFDLDGVLIDAKEFHFQAFGQALEEMANIKISREQQLELDGLPTKVKLAKMGIDDTYTAQIINAKKQAITAELFNQVPKDEDLIKTLKCLSEELGYKLSVASNSRRNTVVIALKRLGIDDYITYYVSNDDVVKPKPSPEMYYKCMLYQGVWLPQTMVIEDSKIGMEACTRGGLSVLEVGKRADVTLDNIGYASDCFSNIFKEAQ